MKCRENVSSLKQNSISIISHPPFPGRWLFFDFFEKTTKKPAHFHTFFRI
nr:MAG TPA: hypothetical protein [Caudoviricetes sp.]